MDLAIQILRFLFRKKWWLIIFPLIAVITALYFTQDLKKEYTSKTTIYTGVITGYNLESSLSNIDQYATNNMMENFLNILRSYTTLRNVSLKLYAQHMVYGDTLNDTKYIWAEHFKPIYQHAPISVKAIIDKNSFEKTYQNLVDYQKEEYNNYIYGLFMWNYSYYGKSTLESIEVSRVKTSDMIELKYTNDDPNVVYHTLTFLNEEFMKQYAIMRDIESDKAITYFENELARVEKNLKAAEEELKKYSIANKVVNYDEQTKQLTAIENAWQTRYQETIMALNSSTKIVEEMEKKFGTSFNVIKENQDFVNKLKQTSSLSHQIALSSIFTEPESSSNNELQSDLSKAEGDLEQYVENYYQFSGTGEALISKDIAFEWLTAYVQREKAMVELEVLQTTKEDIDQMYKDFSPIGINIKQQNRVISFLEKEYISLMESLNTAKLRKKNTQVSTANLQIITPPQLPLAAEPTKRKSIVLLSGLATFFFIIGFFIFIELVDRTLKNRDRTERLTGGKYSLQCLPKHEYDAKNIMTTISKPPLNNFPIVFSTK